MIAIHKIIAQKIAAEVGGRISTAYESDLTNEIYVVSINGIINGRKHDIIVAMVYRMGIQWNKGFKIDANTIYYDIYNPSFDTQELIDEVVMDIKKCYLNESR